MRTWKSADRRCAAIDRRSPRHSLCASDDARADRRAADRPCRGSHTVTQAVERHAEYGPWLALRAVVVVDADGPTGDRVRAHDPCTPVPKPCLAAFDRAVAATDVTRPGTSSANEKCGPKSAKSAQGLDFLRRRSTPLSLRQDRSILPSRAVIRSGVSRRSSVQRYRPPHERLPALSSPLRCFSSACLQSQVRRGCRRQQGQGGNRAPALASSSKSKPTPQLAKLSADPAARTARS
jgi:hypothetical protein